MTTSSETTEQSTELRAEIDFSVRHPVMFFFTSAAAWLGVALILGLLFSVKSFAPEGVWWLPFDQDQSFLNPGKLYGAQMGALIFGWAVQASLGLIIWLTSRLTRKTVKNPGIPLVLGHIWNLVLGLGVFAILAGGGSGRPWMELPQGIYPALMFCYMGVIITPLIQFHVRERKEEFISQWYINMAIVLFPVVLAVGYVFSFEDLSSPLMAAAGNAWYRSAIVYLFLIPASVSALYYLVAKITGRPIFSYPLSSAAMWAYIIIAPWAGIEKLSGAPIAQFIPNIGAVAKMLLLIPFTLIAYNVIKTVSKENDIFKKSPSLQFVIAGAVLFVVLGVVNFLINIPSALSLTQFTVAQHGIDMLAILGAVSFTLFGAIYFIVPRITRREWISSDLIRKHYIFVIYSCIVIVSGLIFGGLMEGKRQDQYLMPWLTNVTESTNTWYIASAIAYALFIFANLFFFLQLLAMWAGLGKVGSEATLYEVHHDELAHGADSTEEDLENE